MKIVILSKFKYKKKTKLKVNLTKIILVTTSSIYEPTRKSNSTKIIIKKKSTGIFLRDISIVSLL